MAAMRPDEGLFAFWMIIWVVCGFAGSAITNKRTGNAGSGFWL